MISRYDLVTALKTRAVQLQSTCRTSLWLKAGPAPALSMGQIRASFFTRKLQPGLIPFYPQEPPVSLVGFSVPFI